MKSILLTTIFGLGLGLAATAPASAVPLPVHGLHAPSATVEVACRMVTKRVRRPNGTVRITKSRVCDRPVYRGGRMYKDRRYHRGPRPGLSIRVR